MRSSTAALLIVAASLAACGGESETVTPTSPSSPSPTGPTPTPTEIPGPDDGVLAILDDDGRFTIFLRILLVEGPERVAGFFTSPVWNNTLFAPTDEAFETLPEGALEYLFGDDPQAEFDLLRVIEHHVVDQVRSIDDFEPGEVTSIAGPLRITVEGDRVMIDGATVIEPDVEASNGIIHVIDGVLIPEQVDLG
ncbi:MAG TPA: fasciclin domain-containing protein [Actinomycetota bacterium]